MRRNKPSEGDRVIWEDTYHDKIHEGTVDWVGSTQFSMDDDMGRRIMVFVSDTNWRYNEPK